MQPGDVRSPHFHQDSAFDKAAYERTRGIDAVSPIDRKALMADRRTAPRSFRRGLLLYEDVDLGLRLRLLGYRALYVADAVVRHVGSGITGRRSAFVTYHTQRNRIWTYIKNMPSPWLWIFLPLHMFYQVLVIGRYASQGQLGPAFRGTLDAMRGMRQTLEVRRAVQRTRRITFAELARFMRWGMLSPFFRR